MTNPTIERAARAAADAHSAMHRGGLYLYDANSEMYRDIARAVLMAVRDIDPAIHDKVTIGGWLDDEMKFSEAWHGGIDAILGVNQSNEP